MMDTLELVENQNGDFMLLFSDELVEATGWKEGDVLDFKLKDSGILITKVNEPEELIELQ